CFILPVFILVSLIYFCDIASAAELDVIFTSFVNLKTFLWVIIGVFIGISGLMFYHCSSSYRHKHSLRERLVTTGPYSFSRNPESLGISIFLISLIVVSMAIFPYGIFFSGIGVCTIILILYGVILEEEKGIRNYYNIHRNKFGNKYELYLNSVPRGFSIKLFLKFIVSAAKKNDLLKIKEDNGNEIFDGGFIEGGIQLPQKMRSNIHSLLTRKQSSYSEEVSVGNFLLEINMAVEDGVLIGFIFVKDRQTRTLFQTIWVEDVLGDIDSYMKLSSVDVKPLMYSLREVFTSEYYRMYWQIKQVTGEDIEEMYEGFKEVYGFEAGFIYLMRKIKENIWPMFSDSEMDIKESLKWANIISEGLSFSGIDTVVFYSWYEFYIEAPNKNIQKKFLRLLSSMRPDDNFYFDGGCMVPSPDVLIYYQVMLDELKKIIQKDIGKDVDINLKDLLAPLFDEKKFMGRNLIERIYFEGKQKYSGDEVIKVYRSIINDAAGEIKKQIIGIFNERINELGWKSAIDEYIRINYGYDKFMEHIVDVVDYSIGKGVYKFIVKLRGEDALVEFFMKSSRGENDYLENEFLWFKLQKLVLGIDLEHSPYLHAFGEDMRLLIMPIIPGESANRVITELLKNGKYKQLKELVLEFMIPQMALGDAFGRNDRNLGNMFINMTDDGNVKSVVTFDSPFLLHRKNYDWTMADIAMGGHELNITTLFPEFNDEFLRDLIFKDIERTCVEIWDTIKSKREAIDILIKDVFDEEEGEEKISLLEEEINKGAMTVMRTHYRALFHGYLYRREFRDCLTSLINFVGEEDEQTYRRYCRPNEKDFTAMGVLECFREAVHRDVGTRDVIRYVSDKRMTIERVYEEIRELLRKYSKDFGEKDIRESFLDQKLDEIDAMAAKIDNRCGELMVKWMKLERRSYPDKERMVLLLKKYQPNAKDIISLGCSPTVIEYLKKYFSDSRIVGMDNSESMLEAVKKRYSPGVEFYLKDIALPWDDFSDFENGFDAVVISSVLSEVVSLYGWKEAKSVIAKAYGMLKEGGILIIRDGIRPDDAEDMVMICLKTNFVRDQLYEFAKGFEPWKIKYTELDNGNVEIKGKDRYEFLIKYIYGQPGLKGEMKKAFGALDSEGYENLLKGSIPGRELWKIKYWECYTLPFFVNRWNEDVKIFDDKLPYSHILLVARKVSVSEGVRVSNFDGGIAQNSSVTGNNLSGLKKIILNFASMHKNIEIIDVFMKWLAMRIISPPAIDCETIESLGISSYRVARPLRVGASLSPIAYRVKEIIKGHFLYLFKNFFNLITKNLNITPVNIDRIIISYPVLFDYRMTDGGSKGFELIILSITQENIGWVFTIIGAIVSIWHIALFKSKGLSLEGERDCEQIIFDEGLYRWIRHPMYFSHMLILLGVVLIIPDKLITLAGLGYLYFINKKASEEESYLKSICEDKYEQYSRRTGKFFPSIKIIKFLYRLTDTKDKEVDGGRIKEESIVDSQGARVKKDEVNVEVNNNKLFRRERFSNFVRDYDILNEIYVFLGTLSFFAVAIGLVIMLLSGVPFAEIFTLENAVKTLLFALAVILIDQISKLAAVYTGMHEIAIKPVDIPVTLGVSVVVVLFISTFKMLGIFGCIGSGLILGGVISNVVIDHMFKGASIDWIPKPFNNSKIMNIADIAGDIGMFLISVGSVFGLWSLRWEIIKLLSNVELSIIIIFFTGVLITLIVNYKVKKRKNKKMTKNIEDVSADGGKLNKQDKIKLFNSLNIIKEYITGKDDKVKNHAENKIKENISIIGGIDNDSVDLSLISMEIFPSLKRWEERGDGKYILSSFIQTETGKKFNDVLMKKILSHINILAAESDDLYYRIKYRFIHPVLALILNARYLHLLHIKKISKNVLSQIIRENGKGYHVNILDSGCGLFSVPILSSLAKPEISYSGTDRDQFIIRSNKKISNIFGRKNTTYQGALNSSLPFEDEKFDLIIAASVEIDIKEINRVIKKGGYIILTSRTYNSHIIYKALIDIVGFKKLAERFSTPEGIGINNCIIAEKPLNNGKKYIFGQDENNQISEVKFDTIERKRKHDRLILLLIYIPIISMIFPVGMEEVKNFLYIYPFLAIFIWNIIKVIQTNIIKIKPILFKILLYFNHPPSSKVIKELFKGLHVEWNLYEKWLETKRGISGREGKGYHSYEHGIEVAYLAYYLGRKRGYTNTEILELVLAASLHDYHIRNPYEPPSVGVTLELIKNDIGLAKVLASFKVDIDVLAVLIKKTDYPWNLNKENMFNNMLGNITDESIKESIKERSLLLEMLDKSGTYFYMNPENSFKRVIDLYRELNSEGTMMDMAKETFEFLEILKNNNSFEEITKNLPGWAKINWDNNYNYFKDIVSFEKDIENVICDGGKADITGERDRNIIEIELICSKILEGIKLLSHYEYRFNEEGENLLMNLRDIKKISEKASIDSVIMTDLDKHKIESVLGQISNPQNPRLDLFVDVLTNLTNTEFKMLNDTSFMKTSSVIQIMKGCLNKCLHCVFKASSFNIEDMPYPMILKIVEKMIPPNNKKIKLFIYNDKELTVMVAAFCPGEPVALKYILPYKTFCLPAKDSGESKVFDGGILKKDSESDKNNSENVFSSWHEIIQLLEHRKYFVERKNVKRYAAFSDCHGDYLGLMKNLLEKGVVAEFIGKEVGVFREDCICIDGVYYYYVDKDMLVVCVGDYAGLLGDSIQLFNLLIWLEINHEAIILVGNHDDGQGKIHNKNGWSEINENDKDIDALFFADFGFSTEEAGKFSRALKDKDLVSLSKVLSENRIMKEKILWAVTRPAVAKISLINGPRKLFVHGGFERDTLDYVISERIGEEEFLTTLERLLQED
ncbi:MAG: methyltransferase domain-containing protein, partial [Candidatus Omnitrophica bacterium]|nr:methyltransferase domain-containing protein [Candidatus Omnitrophota bacterium]